MYYEYFGLKQPPFKITPDTSLFFPGGNRGAVLQALIYAVTQGEGIVKVVGEVGAGKTMLCRMLQVELPDNVEIVYLDNPSLSPENILHAIAFELKLNVSETDNRLKVMNELQNYLLDRHAENRQIVVFIEEAQGATAAPATAPVRSSWQSVLRQHASRGEPCPSHAGTCGPGHSSCPERPE